MAHRPQANLRRAHLVDALSAHRLRIVLNHGIARVRCSLASSQSHRLLIASPDVQDAHTTPQDIMFRIVQNACHTFLRDTSVPFAIVCDDDWSPHANLLDELNATVALLPPAWRSLHLCPGFCWNRQRLGVSLIFFVAISVIRSSPHGANLAARPSAHQPWRAAPRARRAAARAF